MSYSREQVKFNKNIFTYIVILCVIYIYMLNCISLYLHEIIIGTIHKLFNITDLRWAKY